MEYRLELRDNNFNLLELLEKEAKDISFEYKRIGGCGGFNFEVPREYGDEGSLGGDFDVRIYRYNPSIRTYDLWFSGFIEEKTPKIADIEIIDVNGYGYVAQLKRVIVNKEYLNTEISAIVKDILDTFVVPNTKIIYEAADIENTGFTADKLTFNTSAMDAIQTCAEIVGSREWGVDRNRKFFFKARSETLTKIYSIGGMVADFSSKELFKDIVNKVYLEGGTVVGVKYTRSGQDARSILKYELREEKKSNSSVTTDDVADQLIAAILAELKGGADIPRTANMTIIGEDILYESSVPLGLLRLETPGIRYGERKYGTFLYSGHINYQVNSIRYLIRESGILVKRIDLGRLRSSLAESISKLEYELEQLRTARE